MKAKSQITKLALACLIGAASPFIPSMRKNKHQETRARNKVAEAEAITKAEAKRLRKQQKRIKEMANVA